jgi:tRNA threonylcarbamoyladenosine biosynthesis protein TsaB
MLLALDTSTPQIGLALYDGAQVLAEHLWVSKARHSAEIAPAVAKTFEQTGISVEKLTALGVAIGPGSFTSLRVGLAFMKGLAFSRNLPIIGINTLGVVAASQPILDRPLACLLPAGRGRLAVAWFRAENHVWQPAGDPRILTAEALSASIEQDSVVCGDLTASERAILQENPRIRLVSPALSVRRPAVLAELAYARHLASDYDNLDSLAPLYLHIAEPIS